MIILTTACDCRQGSRNTEAVSVTSTQTLGCRTSFYSVLQEIGETSAMGLLSQVWNSFRNDFKPPYPSIPPHLPCRNMYLPYHIPTWYTYIIYTCVLSSYIIRYVHICTGIYIYMYIDMIILASQCHNILCVFLFYCHMNHMKHMYLLCVFTVWRRILTQPGSISRRKTKPDA